MNDLDRVSNVSQRVGDQTLRLAMRQFHDAVSDRPAADLHRLKDVVHLKLSAEVVARARALAEQCGVSQFIVLLASWTALLARWSGQEQIDIGIWVADRQCADASLVAGVLERSANIRLQIEHGEPAERLLRQVNAAVAQAYADRGVLFESVSSPYPVITAVMEQTSSGARGDPSASGEGAEFDLALSEDINGAVTVVLEYVVRLIERGEVECMTACWETLLGGLIATPERPISRLPLLSIAQREQILYGFNDTARSYPSDTLVHELFEEQVRQTPRAVAVLYEQESVTYEELNSRANQLARYLRSKGVSPDQPVAMYLDRSVQMIVGVLGILKAGGVYLPLEPGYPSARLAYILADAAPKLLLTRERLVGTLPPHQAEIVALDIYWPEISRLEQADLERSAVSVNSRNLAYVIYTSGSTGEPKGVEAEHRGMANRIIAHREINAFSDDDICCQKTSIGFVDAIFEILGPLSYGRPLVVAPMAAVNDVQQLVALIDSERITRLVSVPSLAQSLLEAVQSPQSLSGLCSWTLSGEELKPDLLRRLRERFPGCTFINLYGSSEVAADATCHVATGNERGTVPIGRPISNIQVYILDRHLEPVPIGMAGLIYIGGVGVARGYLNRASLTADRFIPDPFGMDPRGRLFSTGDVGRWRADGTVEYLGRGDQQVKIRGFRVELGEIEVHLMRHAMVAEAAVVLRESVQGEKRLVAYVMSRSSQFPSAASLRRHLQAVLPDYMIPGAFVAMERLPRTLSGKLDRRALPEPTQEAYVSRPYEIPRGVAENILAEIWQDLLGVPRVGRRDNFFELGGHSLQVMRMLECLRKKGLSVEAHRVFDSPTLEDLAGALVEEVGDKYRVQPNLIPPECTVIVPDMLPLVSLDESHIEHIVSTVPGGAANVQDIYPLTPLQEGLLLHHLLDQDRGETYVVTTVLSAASRDRLDKFVRALQVVIDRHDILRSAILWENLPRPVQVVYRRAILNVELVTLDQRRDTLEQIKECSRPSRQRMELRSAPLVRLIVAAEPGRDQWYALLQSHHLVGDDESLRAMLEEVVTIVDGRWQELPDPIPYRNHVAQALVQVEPAAVEDFFREKLAGIDESTAPFGLTDIYGNGDDADEASEQLDRSLAQRLREQARMAGVSPAVLFHAAWALVVARLSGRDDVVFGTVLLGRLQGNTGARQVLGMFINTLPLRLDLQKVAARELVDLVHRELADLLRYEQAPLALAQRCSGLSRSMPLFSTLLNYRHGASGLELHRADSIGIRVLTSVDRTNYPITLSIDDLASGFTLTAQTDRRVESRRMLAYLETAVGALVEALENEVPASALTLSVLPQRELHQIAHEFNSTKADYDNERLIHELFEEQAERTPDATSVICNGESLTYAELNGQANQLARHLRDRGVGPEQLVGICVERTLEMVVGLLGILKAGGAYVPLDPKYPVERLAYMMGDARPRVLLTQERLRTKVTDRSVETVCLDSDWHRIARYPAQNLSTRALGMCPQQMAYVLYTSGSTGRPKGVVIEHRNAVNLINWARSSVSNETFRRTLQATSLNFDLSVYECFVPLTSGGSIRIVENALELIKSPYDVTLINTVPSAIKGLLDAGAIPCATQIVNLAGEALRKELVDRIFTSSSVRQVCNLYGPSETTTYSTWVSMSREDGFDASIGRPVANTQIYILSPQRQPVPVGVVGEIYIGGAGVARGYLNQPEMTAERFMSDPFGSDPNARMYKTGDLARWRADGSIEYLGRNDHQVKIRGYRIELSEIEAQLTKHACVKDAVVVAREEAPGDSRLIAYIVQHEGMDSSVDSLRVHLKTSLPEHMVPSAYVFLDRMPLTPNGKLDRLALPSPESEAYTSRQYEPPRGAVEEIVARIWQDLLHVERVGRRDNFFELGGHSLLVVQIMERLRRAGLPANVRSVFESGTLAELADALSEAHEALLDVPPSMVPNQCEEITPQLLPLVQLQKEHIERIVGTVPGGVANVQDIYPLAPLQEGILFHHQLNRDDGDTYVLPILMSLSSREALDVFIGALQEIVDRHDVLRTAVLWEGLPQAVQVVYRRASLPVAELLLDPGRDVVGQLRDRMRPEHQKLELRKAPMLQLQVAADPHSRRWYALMQMHHLMCDHESIEIMLKEVKACIEGNRHRLAIPTPYRNHVARTLAHARTADAEAFFSRKLGDVDEPSAPFGIINIQGGGARIAETRMKLEPALASRVRNQARVMGVSAATIFHAAWALVVGRTACRDDVVFGTLLFGRMLGAEESQRSLGMFVNTLPLRVRLQGQSVAQLVEQTQRELVELLSHEQASLVAAQRCSGLDGTVPLFTTLFNYRHSTVDFESELSDSIGLEVLAEADWTNYPITLSIDDFGSDFALTMQSDLRIDPTRMVGYMATATQSLVEQLERAPQTSALTLAVLPETERRQIEEFFNETDSEYPKDKLVHHLVEAQVERTARAIAVQYAEQSITYAELNGRANRLARLLREKGVGSGHLVGICAERSPEMVVGLLGILKAGAAYVPLDPAYPQDRLAYMLDDASPRVLLTQERLRALLPSTKAEVVTLDADMAVTADFSQENLLLDAEYVDASSRVYVIYTSGSTGRPKGTQMGHRSMVNLIEWHRRVFSEGSGKRVLQFAALSFDVAFQEIFSTLCTGGTLVLLDEWVRRDARALTKLLSVRQIHRLFIPPLMLQSIAEDLDSVAEVPTSLEDVIVAGEQLRIGPEVANLFERLVGCRLHNHYGPTESHVVTALTLAGDSRRWPTLPSIGRPISNTQIYILDHALQSVPLGVAGEIYIGGANVALGYLNRPELTAQRFISDPFRPGQGTRLYRTGDVGRWTDDGSLEFLGRSDSQAKIRGYRIEPGEIEAHLVLHERVREAAVIVHAEATGEKRLVAYITARGEHIPTAEELRRYLATVLPDYMIPAVFVNLQALPVTPSGKLDRRGLPAPLVVVHADEGYEAPRGQLEEILGRIWCELLKLERVDRHESFFEIGGHSLLASRAVARISDALNIDIPLRLLFEKPTIESLSDCIANEIAEAQ